VLKFKRKFRRLKVNVKVHGMDNFEIIDAKQKTDGLQLQECQAIGDTSINFIYVINTVHLIGAVN
jgi:hypothetical protein